MNPEIRNMNESFGFGAFKDVTNIHPVGLAAVLILGLAVLFLPRRWAIFPMICIACIVPSAQKLVILGLDFNFLRIMVVFGFMRLLIKKEHVGFVWTQLDTMVILWSISAILIFTFQQGTFSTFINRLGFGFDVFGMYFLFRCLIRDWVAIDRIVLGVILISIPIAIFFLIEQRTGHNMFSIFGGVSEKTIMRQGRLRCRGAFDHSILAGCFWASLLPLIAAYWWKSTQKRILAVSGAVSSIVIVICCASSTPVGGVATAMIGGLMFWFRRKMKIVRWVILLSLIGLHIVMEAPIWHLISRVGAVGGSTGHFRYQLINGAIEHFNEWALLGTKSTAHWFWGAQDVTNHFILEGARGGFLTLFFFVAVIIVAFREVGKILHYQSRSPYRLALAWAIGVSLLVHCANFLGIAYFGQIRILLYLLLAMIGSLSTTIPDKVFQRKIRTIPAMT